MELTVPDTPRVVEVPVADAAQGMWLKLVVQVATLFTRDKPQRAAPSRPPATLAFTPYTVHRR